MLLDGFCSANNPDPSTVSFETLWETKHEDKFGVGNTSRECNLTYTEDKHYALGMLICTSLQRAGTNLQDFGERNTDMRVGLGGGRAMPGDSLIYVHILGEDNGCQFFFPVLSARGVPFCVGFPPLFLLSCSWYSPLSLSV